MTFPYKLEVIVEGYDKEQHATLLRTIPFAPDVAEYQIEDESRFCIDMQYIDFCRQEKKPPHIPAQVISENKARREKLEFGQQQLAKEKKQSESGIILPDGYEV